MCIPEITTAIGKWTFRKCPICKTKTEHSEHGFRFNNYRLICKKCDNITYKERI